MLVHSRRMMVTALLAAHAWAAVAAEQVYPVRYHFRAGETLVYETVTAIDGSLAIHPDGDDERRLPVALQLGEQVLCTILAVDDETGLARVEIRLRRFSLGGPGRPGAEPLQLEVVADGVRVSRGESTWMLPLPRPGQRDELPPEAREGFGALDPRLLALPATLTIDPAGAVTATEGTPWYQRLAEAPVLGPAAALIRPFGEVFPELPGKDVALGQEWRQRRLVPLPGGDVSYPLEVRYELADLAPGEPPTAQIEYDGEGRAADQAFVFPIGGGVALPMTLEQLTHRVEGRALFDLEAGRLVEQVQVSEVSSGSRGQTEQQTFSIEATMTVKSTMMLVEHTAAAP